MADTVLITGGAGFIGRHVARALLAEGHRVRVLDSLIEQVHGGRGRPTSSTPTSNCIVGDVRDDAAVRRALAGVDKVVHLAAEVGVGQSMYAVDRYVSVNDLGTAVLFQQLIERPVRRVVVASSMSIYGEGLYRTADGALVEDAVRQPRTGADAPWDPLDATAARSSRCRRRNGSGPTLASVYALTKYVQERLTLTLAPAYGMEGVALRLFNVYGPGQALSNPYTGVLAIFASRLANGQRAADLRGRPAAPRLRPRRRRRRAPSSWRWSIPRAAGEVFNIGSGEDRSGRGGRARCSPRRWAAATSRPRSPARRAPATSATASPTSPRRATELGFGRAARLRARARANSPNGWRGSRPSDRVARGARELEARGWWHDGGAGARRARGGRPILVTGGAGFIGSNLADRLARDGHDVLVYDAWRGPASSATSTGCKARHPRRVSARRRRHPRRAQR